jgi:integrase
VYYATAMVKGRQYNELVGTDKREATRVEARIKRELREGTFQPKARRTGAVTAASFATTWGAARPNRTANDDRQRLRDYFELYFGSKIRMNEITEREAHAFVRWLAELVRAGKIAARTARHIRGVVRTMFRDAKLEGVIASDPFSDLPRKLLPKPARHERDVYSRQEVGALLEDERVLAPVRVLLAMMLYMGVREGEACGRRWRDWDATAEPLGSMNILTQYSDEPPRPISREKCRCTRSSPAASSSGGTRALSSPTAVSRCLTISSYQTAIRARAVAARTPNRAHTRPWRPRARS